MAQDPVGFRQEVIQHLSGESRLGGVVQGVNLVDLDPHLVGIVVADPETQPRPPEDNAGPVAGAGTDLQGDALIAESVQVLDKGAGIGDAPGPPVHHGEVVVHRAQVAPQGHIPRLQVHAQPRDLDGAPAGIIALDVVAQDGQVAGVAAGALPYAQGVHQAGDAPGRQAVQVGGVRRLQGGEAPQFPDGPVSQTIHDDEHGFIHQLLLGVLCNAVAHGPVAQPPSMKSSYRLVVRPFQAVPD